MGKHGIWWRFRELRMATDIVKYLQDLHAAILRSIEERKKIDEARRKDPNWKWSAIHICSKEVAEIMMSDDTPPEIKHRLSFSTYAGEQWIWVGEGPEPTKDGGNFEL